MSTAMTGEKVRGCAYSWIFKNGCIPTEEGGGFLMQVGRVYAVYISAVCIIIVYLTSYELNCMLSIVHNNCSSGLQASSAKLMLIITCNL